MKRTAVRPIFRPAAGLQQRRRPGVENFAAVTGGSYMIHFSCEKALLQSAITISTRAVSSKSTIPALEGLLLNAENDSLTVSGYNM